MTSAPSEEVSRQYALLAELPRPRPVRMSRQGKRNVTLLLIALVLLAGGLVAMTAVHPSAPPANVTPPPRFLLYVLPIGLVALLAFVMRRSLERQRRLLAEGELAMARVTEQWIARGGNGIRYEFATPAGETFSRKTIDNARELVVGMSTPVFYDPQRPSRQVPLCASFYKVMAPGEE